MKKLLGSTLALVLIAPTMANAELLKNLQVSGSLDVSDISANNISDLSSKNYDAINTVQTRLMLGADWDLLDDVHSHISLLKNNREYGSGPENLSTVQSNIVVQEANVKIDKLFGAIDTKVGRQYYGDPGDLVIYFGPRNDYGLTVTALDGATFAWAGDKVGAKVLLAKTANNSNGLAVNDFANQTIAGFDINAKPTDNASGNAYLYDRETVNSGNAANTGVVGNDYLYVAGLKGKITAGGAWLKAEIAKDFGSYRQVAAGGAGYPNQAGNYTGMAGLIEVGDKVDVNNIGALTGWASGGWGTGGNNTASPNRNFTAIAGDYRPGGIAGRFWSGSAVPAGSAVFGAGNGVDNGTLSDRVDLGAGVKYNPAQLSKLTVALSVWDYHASSAASVPSGNKNAGYEGDLDVTWKHSENVSVAAGVGDFQPGGAIQNVVAANSPATLGYLDLHIKF